MGSPVNEGLSVPLSEARLNSARFPDASAVAAGFALPGVNLFPKSTKAVESVAQSLVFGGEGFCEGLLNPVQNRFMGIGNKGRKFSRVGFQHGKLVEFLPILRTGRAIG